MKFIDDKNFNIDASVVCLGNFDGVHLGHKKVIDKVIEIGNKNKINKIAFSFDPHPASILISSDSKYLFSKEEKKYIFSTLDLDYLILFPFDNDTRNLTPESFFLEILIKKLNCKYIVVGEDYSFGKRKSGNIQLLNELSKNHNIELIVVPHINYLNTKLSSTTIRERIEMGNIEDLNKLLFRPYILMGEIVAGKKLGRTIGFPTINILLKKNKLIPKNGVYKSKVIIDNVEYKGLTNIGINPTVSGDKIICETYIFDFNENVYGKTGIIFFEKFVRSEKKFSNIEDLKIQIDKDLKGFN